MTERSNPSRRKILRAAARFAGVGLAGAGSWPRIARADRPEKMTRQQAEYQDTPNGIYSCGLCTLFEPPSGCKVVEGDVSKEGWCKAFALAD